MNWSGYAAGVLAFCLSQSHAAERTMTLAGPGACQDGHAWSSRPDERRGSYYFIDARAWTWNGQGDGAGVTRSFFACDLSGLPENARVISAVLGLYQDRQAASTNANTRHSTQSGSNELVVERIISPWSEQTVSWNNQPATTQLNQVIVPASTSPIQDYQVDVTPLLKDAVANHDRRLGLALRLLHEQPYRAVVFSSNDNADPGSRPRLVITYETGAADRRPTDLPVDDDREPINDQTAADQARQPVLEWTPKAGQ